MENKKNKNTFLTLAVLFFYILAPVLALSYETDLLPIGILSDDPRAGYLVTILMELLSICAVPIAIKIYFSASAKTMVSPVSIVGKRFLSRRQALIQILLGLIMVIDTYLYYQLVNVSYAYMSLILYLVMLYLMINSASKITQ